MLTDVAIRKIKPVGKVRRYADAQGLYLEVTPTAAKYWRMKYRFAGREKRLAFGVYPGVSLAEARTRRDEARAALRDGRDPGEERKAAKAAALSVGETFGVVAAEWLHRQRGSMAAATFTKAQWMLDQTMKLHARPIREIAAPEVLSVLRAVELGGRHETTHRIKQRIGQVMRYAVATGRAERDVTADLRGALIPPTTRHHPAITEPAAVGDLLRAIKGFSGQPATHAALKLAPYLFQHPGNVRAMEWAELDLDAAEWRIPAEKMKMGEAHVVPLSKQAVAVLKDIQAITGRGRYCFPSNRGHGRPLSNNTLNAALRRLGFDKDTMTAHGFRAMASSLLNEQGWNPDVIERQLAHAERNKVRAAYNRAQYLAERRTMMQAWAEYLDALGDNAQVIPFKRKSTRAA
ncbi:MAG: tyrosine-type recombinase/integrase [Rhodanobacteraceae bacterium]